MPEEDKTELRTKDELMAKITVSMGGRAAEEVVMNTMTNGAAQDIQDATGIARNMVAMFGMSDEFGMMALASRRTQYLDGGYGMDVAQCYQSAVETIRENRDDMDKVVAYLLEKETITGGEMIAIIEGRDPSEVENPYASTASNLNKNNNAGLNNAAYDFRPSQPDGIEPPAKKSHMISEKIEPPENPENTLENHSENPGEIPSENPAENASENINLEKPEEKEPENNINNMPEENQENQDGASRDDEQAGTEKA